MLCYLSKGTCTINVLISIPFPFVMLVIKPVFPRTPSSCICLSGVLQIELTPRHATPLSRMHRTFGSEISCSRTLGHLKLVCHIYLPHRYTLSICLSSLGVSKLACHIYLPHRYTLSMCLSNLGASCSGFQTLVTLVTRHF